MFLSVWNNAIICRSGGYTVPELANAVRKLSQSVQKQNFLSPRYSAFRKACHSTQSLAMYTLVSLGCVHEWEASSCTDALLTPLSVFKPPVYTIV